MSARTIPELLESRAAANPSGWTLTVLGETRSANDLRARAYGYAALLRDRGVAAGDRVAVMADNCIEVVELWFGCSVIGAIFTPINTAVRGAQLAHLLEDAEPIVLVAASMYQARLSEAGVPASVRHGWTLDAADPGATEFEQLPEPTDTIAPDSLPQSSDACALLYTSGTTGPSKGVACSHAQLYWWGRNTASALEISGDDVLYTCLPLFHMNALNTILQSLYTGASATVGPRFSASKFWKRVTEADATVTYLLGAMVSILVSRSREEYDPGHRVRIALAPATSPAIWSKFETRFGVTIIEGHGMTETNLAIGPRDGEQRPGWMGRPMPGFHARVVDDADEPVAPNVPGELVVRPDNRETFAIGYWRQPEFTSVAWRGGWFHTGDRVLYDEDGYFRFVDRIKDAIRRRGENISAWEVEQALERHETVSAAAVVPVPSELGEDEVLAYVVPLSGARVDPVELIKHCEGHLAYFAIPRYIEIVDELPLTETGKVQKVLLRANGLRSTTWDREREGIQLER